MDNTTWGLLAQPSDLTTPGVESDGDNRPVPADGSQDFLKVYARACAYFEAQGLDHMNAQDLAVETSLRWLTHSGLGRPAGRAWLRQVERNLLIDHVRRRAREQRLLESYAGTLHDSAGEDRRPKELCAETLAALPPADRGILFGHYVEGFSVQELALRLQLSADCVKQRLHRARHRAQSLLVQPPLGLAHCAP